MVNGASTSGLPACPSLLKTADLAPTLPICALHNAQSAKGSAASVRLEHALSEPRPSGRGDASGIRVERGIITAIMRFRAPDRAVKVEVRRARIAATLGA